MQDVTNARDPRELSPHRNDICYVSGSEHFHIHQFFSSSQPYQIGTIINSIFQKESQDTERLSNLLEVTQFTAVVRGFESGLLQKPECSYFTILTLAGISNTCSGLSPFSSITSHHKTAQWFSNLSVRHCYPSNF